MRCVRALPGGLAEVSAAAQLAHYELAAAQVFYVAGFGHGNRDINNGGQGVNPGSLAHARRVVHTILQTDDNRTGGNVGCQRARGGFRISGLDAKKNHVGTARGRGLG